jgi:TPR repeat protein
MERQVARPLSSTGPAAEEQERQGDVSTRDLELARELEVKRANALRGEGDLRGCVALLQSAASKGSGYAMWLLARAYHYGSLSMPYDAKEAIRLYQAAAAAGFAPAFVDLALNYRSGPLLDADPVKAEEWAQRAVQSGDHYTVATCFYFGIGVALDEPAARTHFILSAESGFALSQKVLGHICYDAKDYVGAFQWWTKSAAQGIAGAQRLLGDLLAEGQGCVRDEEAALKCYIISATQENSASNMRAARLLFKTGQWRRGSRFLLPVKALQEMERRLRDEARQIQRELLRERLCIPLQGALERPLHTVPLAMSLAAERFAELYHYGRVFTIRPDAKLEFRKLGGPRVLAPIEQMISIYTESNEVCRRAALSVLCIHRKRQGTCLSASRLPRDLAVLLAKV